ncbi:MAG: signal peptidase I [Lachnospiraceae bacterium]|nr:signal peptidase I [Lachnospiraceae bacterium]
MEKRKESSFLEMTGKIVIAALLVAILLLNLFTHVMPVMRYYGTGMEPTLHDRQILFVLKTDELKEGDIAVFYYNNKVLVRRVVCEGGKQISIDKAGNVSVNGQLLEEPYLTEKSLGQCNIEFPLNVPMGQYFVMGDVRDEAMDSRLSEIGTISKERMIGKVLFAF